MALTSALLALLATPVVAWQSRCRALDQYQGQPMIFRCEGAKLGFDGSASHNQFRILVPPGTTYKVLDIPIGTRDFRISMSSETIRQSVPAGLFVLDGTTQRNLRDQMQEVQLPVGYQDKQYNVSFLGMRIDYYEHLASPRSQQVIFHGPTPGPLSIMVQNLEAEEVLVHFKKYSYQPFTEGPMCGFEKPASGCDEYDQTLARSAVVEFCKNVVDQFPTPFEAWTFAMQAVGGKGSTIPYYMWRKIWTTFSPRPEYTWKAYKFITHGGFESNTKAVTQENLNFCYRIAKVDAFAQGCCAHLKKTYPDADVAFRKQAEFAASEKLASGEGLFRICSRAVLDSSLLPSRHEDYLDTYLDADGYQGLLPRDLRYCWIGTDLGMPSGTRAPLPAGYTTRAPVAPIAAAAGPTVSPMGYNEALAQAGPSASQEFPSSASAAAKRLVLNTQALPSPVQSLGFAAVGLSICGCVCAGVLLGAFLCRRSRSKLREAQLASPYGPHEQLAVSPNGPMHYLLPEE